MPAFKALTESTIGVFRTAPRIAMMIAAFPGTQPVARPRPAPPRELGTAPKGWFEEAEKQFH